MKKRRRSLSAAHQLGDPKFLDRPPHVQNIHVVTLDQPKNFAKFSECPFPLCTFAQISKHFWNGYIGLRPTEPLHFESNLK